MKMMLLVEGDGEGRELQCGFGRSCQGQVSQKPVKGAGAGGSG